MIGHKLRVLGLLLYKNTLVRLRQWKLSLFIEVLMPILLFLSIWSIRNAVTLPPHRIETNITYEIEPGGGNLKFTKPILIAPDNEFTRNLTENLKNCLSMNPKMPAQFFPTENEMLFTYRTNISQNTDYSHQPDFGIVIQNTENQFSYKIFTSQNIPKTQYSSLLPDEQVFKDGIIEAQICIDKSVIEMKKNDSNFKIQIDTLQMPDPSHLEQNMGDKAFRQIFCVFFVAVFLIPLCIETLHASSEKFLGINVLMSMNGVPNYLNILSWLISGLAFSVLYTIPIELMLYNTSNDYSVPFLHYGNSILFWLVLTFNVAHLLAFGMHISAYFTRSLFMVTGIIVIYVGTTAIQQYGVKENAFTLIPYFGIFFPNLLLSRALEEINYYEVTAQGVHWSNIFIVGNRIYGIEGSVGMILIFSIIGTVLHLIFANHIYAINPGKYGVKKSPFYFLKFLRKATKDDSGAGEDTNNKSPNARTNLFEKVSDNTNVPGIRIRNLKKVYKSGLIHKTNVYAVRGISEDFHAGQITALLGHNGAGKTTMMSILTGMISPTEGSVFINGKNINEESEEIMNDMGLCPQEDMLFPYLSVSEQLRFFAMLKNKSKSRSEIKEDVTELLEKLNMLHKYDTLPKELSGGQKRRVSLGMALIGDPSVLILDEPTSGLDPETKRSIWDELLRLRESKTILISTHDMEEADILGDKISIVHTGQLKSSGSCMFLKKLIGEGNVEITLSTKPDRSSEEIRSCFHPQTQILNAESNKIVLSTPSNDDLPDYLDKIEAKKEELGITGMSVSMITLEKVFLKVTKDNDEAIEIREPFVSPSRKLEGRKLLLNSLKALLLKKLTYTTKNISTPLIILCLLAASLACIIFMLRNHSLDPAPVPITFDLYSNSKAYYRANVDGKVYGETYTAVAGKAGIKTVDFPGEHEEFINALTYIGFEDYFDYLFHSFIGAEFESNTTQNLIKANVLYNQKEALFALPISTNLVSNTLLKTVLGADHSIGMSVQKFPTEENQIDYNSIKMLSILQGFIVAIILVSFLYPAIALFIVHPIKESLSGVKHLQRMAGVSCFSYWGTMFTFDFLMFFGMTIIFLVAFVIFDAALQIKLFATTEFFVMLLLFVLFAVNILPLIYIFSFWKRTASAAIKLLSLLPLGLLLIEFVMSLVSLLIGNMNATWYCSRLIQKRIFMLIPYISFFHGQLSFFRTATLNAGCKILASTSNETIFKDPCQNMTCVNGSCTNAVNYFNDRDEDVALQTSVIYMLLTPFLYVAILCLLEYKLVPKLIAKIRRNKPDFNDNFLEEQVKTEKDILSFEIDKIKNKNNTSVKKGATDSHEMENGRDSILPNNVENDYTFLVYELRKLYGKLVAVQNVSFGVKQGECFGLLGVNGAGKSTTFKMMTGEEIPNHGSMYLNGKNLRNNYNSLAQIGYCPQTDAIIRSLNAYDHLTLFARLRGIPEHEVESEVREWIDKLNLKACASQPSGTYSGGNKRRLNIAMALIGIPNLVLMDEPTTGVDPAARRSLWTVIQACQATGLAVILTSHSMEECEALCNRLTIMVNGKLVCLGASQELKQRFGAGYDIQLKLNTEKSREEIHGIKEEMIEELSCEVVDENPGYLMFHIPSTQITWRRMYDVVNNVKSKYTSIEDFSVLSSSLEQLFLLFARTASNLNSRLGSV